MTMSRPFFGLMPNWMLEPPVSTPISRMIFREASRRIWYSLSVSVWAGATVMESPVCTPMASKFSIEQMITTLSAVSLITSSSYSFQPMSDSSTRISSVGDASIPAIDIRSYSSMLYAMPPPVPPRVKEGRMMAGKPTILMTLIASA